MARLTVTQVRQIKFAPMVKGRDLARTYGVSPSAICDIRKGKRWTHVSVGVFLTLLIAQPAYAQSAAGNAQSGSMAAANVYNVQPTVQAGLTQRVETVPGVITPSFYGANPCSNSISAGGAVLGLGLGGGAQWTESECRSQEWFRFLNMAGKPRVADALVCAEFPKLRAAYMAAGQPCPQDEPAPTPQPVSRAADPTLLLVSAPMPTVGRTEYCDTASREEKRRMPECGGGR